MEFALPELLSRDDMLSILNQRQLHISNMNELTHEELMRVYKTFVMPLSRRPGRSRVVNKSHNILNKAADYEDQMHIEHSEYPCMSMDIDVPSLPIITDGVIETHNRMISPFGEKRRQRESDDEFQSVETDYQYQLSSATKRIKINSLS